LPRNKYEVVEIQEESAPEILPGRGETVLLVEDDLSILELIRHILDGLGYTVLIAGTPAEAIDLAENQTGKIHLLITDLIMPEMNGKELAEKIRKTRPAMKCLFMSGYSANVVAERGMLDEGIQFIEKPFSMKDIAAKVRTTLEKEPK
jgi:DNA-binding NtrC family response regulator